MEPRDASVSNKGFTLLEIIFAALPPSSYDDVIIVSLNAKGAGTPLTYFL